VAVRGLNLGGWSVNSRGAGVTALALFVANVAIVAGLRAIGLYPGHAVFKLKVTIINANMNMF
jgi:hypothetical protein